MSININSTEYEIIKQLGEGGYGKVYLVLNNLDNMNYALKEFPIKGETKDKIQEIKNEAEILSKFNHKNIVKYYESFENDDKFFILMEYCDGQNLSNIINEYTEKNELIQEEIILNIIKQICLGIKEIHDKNIIHRDLKPENIFMNTNGEIKIGDFGISKELNLNKTCTKTNIKKGTFYYIAPEILNKGIYNEKADIYSLGCIIYELFHLSIYSLNRLMGDVKKIDENIYNPKRQELIDLLLQIEYSNRPNINDIIDFISFDESDKNSNDVQMSGNSNSSDIGNIIDENNLENNLNIINENNNIESSIINDIKNDKDNYVYNLDKNIEIKKIIRKLNKIEEEKILEYFDLKSK